MGFCSAAVAGAAGQTNPAPQITPPLRPACACSRGGGGEGFLEIYREVTAHFPVRGNLVPDAHLAALLRQHGVRRLYTVDRDFRKFNFLEVADPFA